jgi:hypothetical protein
MGFGLSNSGRKPKKVYEVRCLPKLGQPFPKANIRRREQLRRKMIVK